MNFSQYMSAGSVPRGGSTPGYCPSDWVCFKDGTRVPQEQYQKGGDPHALEDIVCPPGVICYEDGSRTYPGTDYRPEARRVEVTPQPAGRQNSTEGSRVGFGALMRLMQGGYGQQQIRQPPMPGPAPGADVGLVCDDKGENCYYSNEPYRDSRGGQ